MQEENSEIVEGVVSVEGAEGSAHLETVVAEDLSSDAAQPVEDEIDAEGVKELPFEEKIAIIEALLLAHGEPLSVDRISGATTIGEDEVKAALTALQSRYAVATAGFELVEFSDQYQFRTKARYAHFVRALKATAPRKLSNAALETLAIVAYRQPIVKSEVERIRGVDATPTLKTLIERNFIRIVGHQQTVGSPALYGTTDEFLALFSLKSLAELPTLRDLKELQAEPGEASAQKVHVTSSASQLLAAQ